MDAGIASARTCSRTQRRDASVLSQTFSTVINCKCRTSASSFFQPFHEHFANETLLFVVESRVIFVYSSISRVSFRTMDFSHVSIPTVLKIYRNKREHWRSLHREEPMGRLETKNYVTVAAPEIEVEDQFNWVFFSRGPFATDSMNERMKIKWVEIGRDLYGSNTKLRRNITEIICHSGTDDKNSETPLSHERHTGRRYYLPKNCVIPTKR